MRFAAVAALAFAAVATASAQTPAPPISDSSSHAGAKPVVVTYRLPAELQCGHPRASTLSLRFPQGMLLPAKVAPGAVRVDGKPAASVSRSGELLVVGITPPSGIQCDVISQGIVTVVVGKGAAIGNPRKPGAYDFSGFLSGQGLDATLRFS